MLYGKGQGDIGILYRNPVYFQKGSGLGLGSLFLGLSKYLLPALKKTGEVLTSQAIKSGKGVIGEMANTAIGRSNKSIRQILSDQGSEAINNLSGEAIRRLKRKLGTQDGSGRPSKRIKTLRKIRKQNSSTKTIKRKRSVTKKQKKKKTNTKSNKGKNKVVKRKKNS